MSNPFFSYATNLATETGQGGDVSWFTNSKATQMAGVEFQQQQQHPLQILQHSVAVSGLPTAPQQSDPNQAVADFMSWLCTSHPQPGCQQGPDPASVPIAFPNCSMAQCFAPVVQPEKVFASLPGLPEVKPVTNSARTPAVKQQDSEALISGSGGDLTSEGRRGVNREDDVHSLMEKVQRRLAQNRESARKCRVRKKAYLQQLQQAVVNLRTTPGAACATGDSTTPARERAERHPSTNSFEVVAPLHSCRRQISEAVKKLRQTADPAFGSEGNLKAVVDECVALVRKRKAIHLECCRKDMMALLTGAHLLPEERILMWMGGSRPSSDLQLVLTELRGQAALSSATEEQLLRLQERIFHQEEMISAGFERVKETLLFGQLLEEVPLGQCGGGGGSLSPQLMGKLDTLQILLAQAEDIRQNTLDALEQLLELPQLAAALTASQQQIFRLEHMRAAYASVSMAGGRNK